MVVAPETGADEGVARGVVGVALDGGEELGEGVYQFARHVFEEGVVEVAFVDIFGIVVEVEDDAFVIHEEVVVEDGGVVGDEDVGVREEGVDVQAAFEEKEVGVFHAAEARVEADVGMGLEEEEGVFALHEEVEGFEVEVLGEEVALGFAPRGHVEEYAGV